MTTTLRSMEVESPAIAPARPAARRRRRSPMARSTAHTVVVYCGAVVLVVVNVFPLYWMLVTGFRDPTTAMTSRNLLPGPFSLDSFAELFQSAAFFTMFKNTLIVACLLTVGTLVIAPPVAYLLARVGRRRRSTVMFSVLVGYMMPEALTVIPTYLLLSNLKIANSIPGVSLAIMGQSLPLGIWLMYTFFKTVPDEIEEAACVDGASMTDTFLKIVLPIARPGILSTGIFAFIMGWTNYMVPRVFLQEDENQLLSVALMALADRWDFGPGVIMAACAVMVLPIVIVVGLSSTQFISGMTVGAVKG